MAAGGDSVELHEKAASLAAELELPLVDLGTDQYEVLLVTGANRIELRSRDGSLGRPIYAEFVDRNAGTRQRFVGSRSQPLGRAVGLAGGSPDVLDATAGLGRDAFRLASWGCRVTAVERSPVVACLLRDGLQRARSVPQLDALIGERLRVVEADAFDLLADSADGSGPEIVYLDPMFPASGRSSGLVKREMRVLRVVVGEDGDAGRLFHEALRVAGRRVVVKRMRHTARLGPEPDVTYRGTIARYDVYFTH